MSRIVSVWLPRWPILRFLRAQTLNPTDKPVDPEAPFVLAVTGSGGPRVAALNEAAEAAGLVLGESLADARAKAGHATGQVNGHLQTRAIDTAADDAALRRLALWATRYTPTAAPWGEENGADGFFLDIEGAAHLFGGEEKLLADLSFRLEQNFGLPARLAVADTVGAAWALARFARTSFLPRSAGDDEDRRYIILPSGHEAQALAPLPVEALRLSPDTCRTLRRLGFKTIGALLDKPRAPFAARFPAELLRRIDQALGRCEEPLVPIVAPPVYHTLRYLLEPIITQEAIVALANRLMHTLVQVLARDDVGARVLRLSLYRVDGVVETIDIALTLPTRNVAHIVRLIDLKLEALAAAEDAGFGFEAVGLAITRAERMATWQEELAPCLPSPASGGGLGWEGAEHRESCAQLIDKFRQRLGAHSVRGFAPIASHLPERAEVLRPLSAETIQSPPSERGRSIRKADRVGVIPGDDNLTSPRRASHVEPFLSGDGKVHNGTAVDAWPAVEQKTRPLLLLPRAEPTEVMALIPDGPPRRFHWRGVTYEVAGSQGPERIAIEWWRRLDPPAHAHASERQQTLTRDYYLVEEAGGHRFWLYREGLYERETTAARWFVHGLFA
jgi:protein ImuB